MPEDADLLTAAVAELEEHVHAAGWDRGPVLFALVRAGRFAADDPLTAARLGIDRQPPEAFTPVEQDGVPEGALDEMLAGIAWPPEVDGCAVTQEIVLLPPAAEAELADATDTADSVQRAARHPDRREARLAVGVLRDGRSAALLRLRGEPDRLTGAELAPNLVAALQATFR